jgi:hypothetical protein
MHKKDLHRKRAPGPRAQADRNAITGCGADLDKTNRSGYAVERTPPRLPHVHWTEPATQPHTGELLTSSSGRAAPPCLAPPRRRVA